MKIFTYVLLILAMAFGLISPVNAQSRKSTVAIQIIFDDSGVLTQSEQAKEQKVVLLGHLRSLTRQRRYAQARIDVISTSMGRSTWIGTIDDLKGGASTEELLKQTEHYADRCNNLSAAFSELETNIQQLERRGYDEIVILVFSSLIDTPVPCNSSMQITLPQLPPDIDVNGILTSSETIKSVGFYWVNHNQRRVWSEYLEPTSNWMRAQGGNFGLFDVENTIYELSSGLIGVSR